MWRIVGDIDMRSFIAIARALSDENRLRALMMLRKQQLCVCQIIEMLGLAPSTVSKHMSILLGARLVEAHKQGRWMYYRLASRNAPKRAKQAIRWVITNLSDAERIIKDNKQLEKLLKIGRDTLCKKQRKK